MHYHLIKEESWYVSKGEFEYRWIDVVFDTLTMSEKEEIAEIIGLNENDFVFGGNLPENFSSRVRYSNDAVSFTVQTLWCKNIPLIHSHPYRKVRVSAFKPYPNTLIKVRNFSMERVLCSVCFQWVI
jgi:hypothetical protein